MPAHVVVPYPATNSTVRTRALHWITRAAAAEGLAPGDVLVHGPGFHGPRVPRATPLLLLRNARPVTRGRHEGHLLARASLGVYDIDDGLPWDYGNLPGLGHWTKRPFPRALVARRAAEAADRVVAGNEVLADWAEQHCADVRIVPTCVEPADYEVRESWDVGDPPVLGWIGSPATEGYLVAIAPALAEVHRRTGARLSMISGTGPVPLELAPFTDKTVWNADSTRMVAQWDVGLMPLRDGVYERAKCGYKLLQYAASGVPAVGSPVGVNRQLLAGMNGLCPEDNDEWVDALTTIIAEPAGLRAERAAAGLQVAGSYSYEAWQDVFLDAVGWSA
jgi:glycosyltransferase involved in cell wall biosynthesis